MIVGVSYKITLYMAHVNDNQKAYIFKAMADKTAYEVGIEYGFDKYYKNAATVGAAVIRIYNQVKNDPAKYLISQEVADTIVGLVTKRTMTVRGEAQRTSLREKSDAEKNKPLEEIVKENSQKAAVLLGLRLNEALSTKAKMNKISLGEIAKVYGITFDKRQLVDGKATDHVALLAKIDGEIDPSQAIEMVMKMREFNQASQEKK